MELKQIFEEIGFSIFAVLIVPFMELKPQIDKEIGKDKLGLNRTFYGIETKQRLYGGDVTTVLIVPFMELKLGLFCNLSCWHKGLNRTFYGIETTIRISEGQWQCGLNRTFYGIETGKCRCCG